VSGGPQLLDGFREIPGVRALLLVDLAGRIVDRVGFDDRRARTEAATLVAGLHAAGARLSEAAGRPGPSLHRVPVDGGLILVCRVPPPGVHILLLHVEGDGSGVDDALPPLLRELAEVVPGGPLVTDAGVFEASLETDR
jgi:hypothetical protein